MITDVYIVDENLNLLDNINDNHPIKKLSNFPEVVKVASTERAPYKITNYIHEVAENVHAFYTECRVIDRDNLEVTSSRLALCQATKIVLKNALSLVGVSSPERM